jgi:hypothetical protein
MRHAKSVVLATIILAFTAVAYGQAPPLIAPEAEFTPPPGRIAVAVDIHRDIAIVASDAPSPSSIAGMVEVYKRQGGSCQASCWTLQQTLFRPNAHGGDRFGASLEWDGRTLVIGSPGNPSAAAGAILIYERAGNTFEWRQTIAVPHGEPNFGMRLSLFRDRLAVSAVVAFSTTNAVYVFERDASGVWSEQAHLTPPQGDEDQFAISIDLHGRRLIAGADQSPPGRYALIFREAQNSWQQEARISAPPDQFGSFGRGVEINGDLALISDFNFGAVNEYRRSNGAWTLVDTFTNDATFFGGNLHLRGKRNLFISSISAIHLYAPSGDTWTPRAEFRVADLFHDPHNEEALDAQGKRVIGVFSGRGYVFDASSGLAQ